MKSRDKIFIDNCMLYAKSCYIKTFELAQKGDFKRASLDKLNIDVHQYYKKYSTKKVKRTFQMFIMATTAIYNNEIITDSNIWSDLTFLTKIIEFRLYKVHKFIQFVENNFIKLLQEGIKYSRILNIKQSLLRGIKC